MHKRKNFVHYTILYHNELIAKILFQDKHINNFVNFGENTTFDQAMLTKKGVENDLRT